MQLSFLFQEKICNQHNISFLHVFAGIFKVPHENVVEALKTALDRHEKDGTTVKNINLIINKLEDVNEVKELLEKLNEVNKSRTSLSLP